MTQIYRPKIILPLLILSNFLSAICYTVLLSFLWFMLLDNIYFYISIIWIILLWTFIWTLINKNALKSLEYTINDETIEYIDGFLNKRHKTVRINRITDISLEQTIFDRFFDIWTIRINTAWSNNYELSMDFIDNYNDAHKHIEKLVQKTNTPSTLI